MIISCRFDFPLLKTCIVSAIQKWHDFPWFLWSSCFCSENKNSPALLRSYFFFSFYQFSSELAANMQCLIKDSSFPTNVLQLRLRFAGYKMRPYESVIMWFRTSETICKPLSRLLVKWAVEGDRLPAGWFILRQTPKSPYFHPNRLLIKMELSKALN